jgi:hypothetical protein
MLLRCLEQRILIHPSACPILTDPMEAAAMEAAEVKDEPETGGQLGPTPPVTVEEDLPGDEDNGAAGSSGSGVERVPKVGMWSVLDDSNVARCSRFCGTLLHAAACYGPYLPRPHVPPPVARGPRLPASPTR